MDPSYNSFGSFGSGGTSGGQPGVIVSAPQAVVTSAQKKKSYRWLIAVVILLLIGVGVGVGVFVLMKGGVVGAGENGFEKSFNIYANFLLYGEDSDKNVDEFNATDTFAIDEKCDDRNYLEKLLVLQEASVGEYNDDRPDYLIDVPFSAMQERIEFLILYSGLNKLDEGTLYDKYESDGADAARAYIEDFYVDTDADGNYLLKLAKEYGEKRSMALVTAWETGEMPESFAVAESALSDLVYGSTSFLKESCEDVVILIEENR